MGNEIILAFFGGWGIWKLINYSVDFGENIIKKISQNIGKEKEK